MKIKRLNVKEVRDNIYSFHLISAIEVGCQTDTTMDQIIHYYVQILPLHGPRSLYFLIHADGSIFYNAEPKDKKIYIERIFSDKKLHFFTSVFLSFYDFCYQNPVYMQQHLTNRTAYVSCSLDITVASPKECTIAVKF